MNVSSLSGDFFRASFEVFCLKNNISLQSANELGDDVPLVSTNSLFC